MFLLSDSQIAREEFLEDINNILNSGEVPNLFELEEYEKIINDVRPLAKAANVPDQRDLIFQHFIHRVKEHLHIVLCMSPVGDNFRLRYVVTKMEIIFEGDGGDEGYNGGRE